MDWLYIFIYFLENVCISFIDLILIERESSSLT
uniref:Uncharacterized protein n=1 Tax=Rhizophora mucronata TaxID=61149 RepID=A0A2P2PKP0_RHIMU